MKSKVARRCWLQHADTALTLALASKDSTTEDHSILFRMRAKSLYS